MKILISGGYGFLGSHIAEKFFREGSQVYIVDNLSTGDKGNVKIKHKSYGLNAADKDCREIFSSNRFEIVIHISAQMDLKNTGRHGTLHSESDFSGLSNLLNLSEKHGVKKLIIISCWSIYGNAGGSSGLPFKEEDKPNPNTAIGINSFVKEYYCSKWSGIFNLKTLALRVCSIYGPRENIGSDPGVIPSFINNIIKKKGIVIDGPGTQTRDFLFVEDFAEGVYLASINKDCTGVLNLSGNKECSISGLAATLSGLYKIKKIRYRDDYTVSLARARLDNSKIKKITGWKPAHSLKKGLKKTYKWYYSKAFPKKTKINPLRLLLDKIKKVPRSAVAYLENVLLFIVIAFIQYNHLFLGQRAFAVGLDYSLVYIVIMGILWGQTQAYIAMFLSSAMFIGATIASGTDIITFAYTPENLLHLAAYLLIGIITGYAIEKRNRALESRDYDLKTLGKKYDFLNDVYGETKIVKDELQNQIIETEDSFGTIYNIVQEVDSLEIEKIFAAAIDAIERIMKTEQVSIYTIGSNRDNSYLRLKTRSSKLKDVIPNSMKTSDLKEVEEVIRTKSIYINHDLIPDVPMMMAPVLEERKVIAIVSLHNISFMNLTVHYENLFQTVIGLISNALRRAYMFEASLKDKRYIENTRILNSKTFEEILGEVRNNETELGMSYSLLKIESTKIPYRQLSDKLCTSIRDNDYIGESKKGLIYVLLSNTKSNFTDIIIDRLLKKGIKSSLVLKGTDVI